jgi:hypothetical protein
LFALGAGWTPEVRRGKPPRLRPKTPNKRNERLEAVFEERERVLFLQDDTKTKQTDQQTNISLLPEWVLLDAAAHAYSMVVVPLYDTLGPDAAE